MNYYNEWDPQAAAWLRELISERFIPRGLVDERSITEVKAEDLEGFTQCHFFAGIGGWPLALQLAGVDHKKPLWTGSPPCQPFSAAGKQLGQFDPRHLAPVFLNLISQCRPPVLFGEQVAAAIGKSWMCDLQTHLEGEDYAVGFAVLPACSVGAPHKRDRLFFGAHQLADTRGERIRMRARKSSCPQGEDKSGREKRERIRADIGAERSYLPDCRAQPLCAEQPAGASGVASGLAESNSEQQRPDTESRERNEHAAGGWQQDSAAVTGFCGDNAANTRHSFWSDADWLGCRDGKWRPVESGTFPLANGIPARVGRLRGYGNAIVPEVAAEFVRAFLAASDDAIKG